MVQFKHPENCQVSVVAECFPQVQLLYYRYSSTGRTTGDEKIGFKFFVFNILKNLVVERITYGGGENNVSYANSGGENNVEKFSSPQAHVEI